MDLIKRLGIIIGIFVLGLLIRTLVSPPVVIVGKLKLIPIPIPILTYLFLMWAKINFDFAKQFLRDLNDLPCNNHKY